jgi:hypothetical protein
MFEGILEKVLQSLFGKYLEGLDKENLHIGVYLDIFTYNCRFGKETFYLKM